MSGLPGTMKPKRVVDEFGITHIVEIVNSENVITRCIEILYAHKVPWRHNPRLYRALTSTLDSVTCLDCIALDLEI